MADEARIQRAQQVEARHQQILDAWATAQSVERIRELESQVIVLRREYVTAELALLGVQFPAQLSPTNPEHAIVLAVRDDLADTERRIDQAIAQQKLGAAKSGTSFDFKLPDVKVDLGPIALVLVLLFLVLSARD